MKDNILKDELKKGPAVQKIGKFLFQVEGTERVSLGFQVTESRSYFKGKIKFYIIPQRQGCRCIWEGMRMRNSKNSTYWGFPGGAVVENLSANAGDTGSSPGLGRSHMPRSN